MKALIDVTSDQLPARFQALIDPEKPLEHPERFSPELRDGGFLSWLILLGCLTLIALLSASLVRALTTLVQDSGGQDSGSVVNIVLAVVFILPLGWWASRQVRFIQAGKAQAADVASGRYRRGVFFEQDAALCFDGTVCTLIPRDSVIRVDRRAAPGTESGARALGTVIDFKGPDGEEHTRSVPGVGWDGKARVWLAEGRIPG